MTTTMTTDAGLPELLAAEPAVLTGAMVGYARVSTNAQLLDRQVHALATAGRVVRETLEPAGALLEQPGRSSPAPDLSAVERTLLFMKTDQDGMGELARPGKPDSA